MDIRFSLTLLVAIGLAVTIGLWAAQSQPKTVASSAPTPAPTAILIPPQGIVEIITNPHGSSPSAVYVPGTVTVTAGATVSWVNLDRVYHTVTADNGSFDSGVLDSGNLQSVQKGQIYRHKFTKPGRYSYTDYLHPDMHALVIVRR